MANIKITDLTAYTDPLNTDVLPIVDVTSDTTKKVSIADLLKNASAGTAAAPSISFDGDPNTGIYSPGADQVAISTNGTGRLFIDASGNVGAGVATPEAELHVRGSAASCYIRFDGATGNGAYNHIYGDTDGVVAIAADQGNVSASSLIKFQVDGTERLRITSTGALNFVGAGTAGSTQAVSFNGSAPVNSLVIDSTGKLGLGTSSPGYRLDVKSPGSGQYFINGQNSLGNDIFQVYQSSAGDGNNGMLFLYNNAGETNVALKSTGASWFTGGNVGIGTANPTSTLTVRQAAASLGVARITRPDSDTGCLYLGNDSNNNALISSNNTELRFGKAVVSTFNEYARIDSSGRLLVGTSSAMETFGGTLLQVADAAGATAVLGRDDATVSADNPLGSIYFNTFAGSSWQESATIRCFADADQGSGDVPSRLVFSTTADGASSPTERMRIGNDGDVLIDATTVFSQSTSSGSGIRFARDGISFLMRSAGPCLFLNRNTNDGVIVDIRQAGNQEGTISVSGTTVSYNGAHLSRWSQLPGGATREEILRGTVLSNIDEMCAWGEEDNEQLNRMKISDVEGDPNVSGVFQAWDDDDDTYTDDFYCAMTGDFVIRIGAGVTVARGDLLMSAGDGTAKPQDDDIIRSKTIAKVTSTHVSETYADGSYCVPCVLMAC